MLPIGSRENFAGPIKFIRGIFRGYKRALVVINRAPKREFRRLNQTYETDLQSFLRSDIAVNKASKKESCRPTKISKRDF